MDTLRREQTLKSLSYATEEDILQAGKAIHDHLHSTFASKIKSLERRIHSLEKELQQAHVLLKKLQVPPPEVTVHVPPPRLLKKTFTYLPDGRPETILEEQVKE